MLHASRRRRIEMNQREVKILFRVACTAQESLGFADCFLRRVEHVVHIDESRGDIQWLSGAQDLIANARIEKLWRHHIDAPAVQQSRELALDADTVEARNMAGLEFHQHVNVTVGAEIVAKDGAKQRQPRNVMSLAERRHRVTID